MIPVKPTVEFDPENPEHVASIKEMLDNSRRDSNIRFHLGADEEATGTFTSVLSKALYTMAYAHMERMAEQYRKPSHEANSNVAAGNVARIGSGSRKQSDQPLVGLPGRIQQELLPAPEAKKLH